MTENYKESEECKMIDIWYRRAKNMKLEYLSDFLKELSEYPHTYNTIVAALGAGSVATCWAMNRTENGGITGFQAGCVMWEFIQRWMDYKAPLKLVNYENMLYPQYHEDYEKTIRKETWEWLQVEAAKRIVDSPNAHPNVMGHWISIVKGTVPFGYSVKEE